MTGHPIQEENPSPAVGPSKSHILEMLGPGLITGAHNDNPGGIKTDAQAGGAVRCGLARVLLHSYSRMAVGE